MKILCVPDLHGRNFWIEPCHNWQGSIVFLGDYHDPYPFQVSKEESLKNLEELVGFINNNKDRCTCLIGNHECHYLNIRCPKSGRLDMFHYKEVQNLLKKLELQWCLFSPGNVIFSHSGILKGWLVDHAKNITDIPDMSFQDEALDDVSPYRGGEFPSYREHKVGSLIWGDLYEYDRSPHIEGYYQIFGHSQQESNPVIKEDYACLDCRKCFIVDTETKEIKEWSK